MILSRFNPELNPEKTIGLETGIRGLYNKLNLEYDVTLFGLFVTDQIIQQTELDGQAIFSNGGDAEHFGIETHFRLFPVHNVTLEFMYTWTDARFAGGEFDTETDVKGNKLPGVAPHRIGSTLSVDWKNHVLSSDIEWIGEYFADSANTARNDSYLLINGRWLFKGIDFGNWKLQPFISVYNIFDVRYNTSVAINNAFGRFYEPGSSRNFQGGVGLYF